MSAGLVILSMYRNLCWKAASRKRKIFPGLKCQLICKCLENVSSVRPYKDTVSVCSLDSRDG